MELLHVEFCKNGNNLVLHLHVQISPSTKHDVGYKTVIFPQALKQVHFEEIYTIFNL